MQGGDCRRYLQDIPYGWKTKPERCDDEILGARSVLSFGKILPILEGTYMSAPNFPEYI